MFRRSISTVALSLLISLATSNNTSAAGNEAVAATIESFITMGSAVLADETDDQRLADIYLYYSDRDFKPIWTRDSGAKTKARVLLKVLKAAAEHGLDPKDYSIDEIEERISSTDPEQLAELDLLISDVFADYGRDLAKGRIDPASTSSEIHVKPKGRRETGNTPHSRMHSPATGSSPLKAGGPAFRRDRRSSQAWMIHGFPFCAAA
jgi:murein L,D-transpeptidase YcbB/YkuD